MLSRLKYLTAGESHGKGLLGIIDGIPAGLEISESYISIHLHRRQQGHGRGRRMKIETDFAELYTCLLYTSPSPRDLSTSRMPSSA